MVELLAGAWALRLHAQPEDFQSPGVTVVHRDGLDAVVTVAFGDSCVVSAPPALSALLSAASPIELQQAELLAALIDGSALDDAPWTAIGTAELWTTDSSAPAGPLPVQPADGVAVDAVRGRDVDDGWDEAGLERMPRRWAALQDGRAVGLAGYEVWPGGVAHLGVFTAGSSRGHGAGYSAAAVAVGDALASGLVPQWRCRVGNRASASLAVRLGFTRVGRQSAVVRQGD